MKNRILCVICLFSILATSLVAVGCGSKSIATPYVAEEFAICTNASEQGMPAISGNTVVWTDKRNGNDDIYGFNLSSDTEFAICTNDSDQSSPAISGNIVVWSGGCDGDFNGYNLGTKEKFTINNFAPNGQAPDKFDISGDIVVWTDYRNDNPDIYGYNLSSGDYFAICTAPYSQSNPDISGDIAVWDDFRNGYGDIYGYNLKTGEEFAVCTNAASQDFLNISAQDFPAISGNIVVWMDGRNGGSIYGARLTFDNP